MPNESKFCPGCGANQTGEVKETVTPTYIRNMHVM
jgi:hypothetical protein